MIRVGIVYSSREKKQTIQEFDNIEDMVRKGLAINDKIIIMDGKSWYDVYDTKEPDPEYVMEIYDDYRE